MIVDIINKKRIGKELSLEELELVFNGYLAGRVKDYQMSSLLMAICTKGMSEKETINLTNIFIKSGNTLDFSDIPGVKVDKHSTGGVGDKTTMVVCPIVASLGIPVIKMSGRGLGHTGGTIDKLESIPGIKLNLNESQIRKQLSEIGIVITGQTENLAPMDKVIYSLRDVTGTVESIPLIASSIMSKKIASGADKILIDLKVGKGALIKTKEEADELSKLMKKIGKEYNKEVRIIITNMNTPLGNCIGNSLEVIESMDILNGKELTTPLTKLCIDLASELVSMAKDITKKEATNLVEETLKDGSAYKKFLDFVSYQGGNINAIEVSPRTVGIKAKKSGTITAINALEIGRLSVMLGAGRLKKEDLIEYDVGIKLKHTVGEKVEKDDVIFTLYLENVADLSMVDQIFTIK